MIINDGKKTDQGGTLVKNSTFGMYGWKVQKIYVPLIGQTRQGLGDFKLRQTPMLRPLPPTDLLILNFLT